MIVRRRADRTRPALVPSPIRIHARVPEHMPNNVGRFLNNLGSGAPSKEAFASPIDGSRDRIKFAVEVLILLDGELDRPPPVRSSYHDRNRRGPSAAI
jgi:hypothetical protein